MKINQKIKSAAKKTLVLASITSGLLLTESKFNQVQASATGQGHKTTQSGGNTGPMGTNWQSQLIVCTVTYSVTLGGGPYGSLSTSTSYQGTMRKCYYGTGFCLIEGACT